MRRKILAVSAVIVSVFLIGTLVYHFVPLYGNSINSIEKIISSHYEVVSIIDVIDMQDYRCVGFESTNGKLGYSVFQKNSFKNYEWKSTEVRDTSSGICTFVNPLSGRIFSDGNMHVTTVTISKNPNLAKVKQISNDQYDEKEINTCPVMVVLDVAIQGNQAGTTYCYYDKNGNQIIGNI